MIIRYTKLVIRVSAKLLLSFLVFLTLGWPIHAYDLTGNGSSVVSATVPGGTVTEINPPILISPENNAILSNPRESLVWKRPSPLPSTPIHHYDVYLDGEVFAASVSDSITSQTYYFYNIRRENDTFYLDMTSDYSQGYHVWKVIVYDTDGNHASTDTRTFYIDSITPFIAVKKVDRQTLNWTTADYTTIPNDNQRALSVSTADPLLTGSVEPYANMQIILMCPQNILNCHNQIYQGNYPTGDWQHRFYGLIRGLVYTVYLSATDAAGNSVIFPEFYLAYGVVSPTPPATITPTLEPSITPPISLTPTVTPEIEVPPTPFIPAPPVSPTPPVIGTPVATPAPSLFSQYWLFTLLVLGLPLHLFMTFYGTQTALLYVFRFIYILLFPFIGKKNYQTVPFTTINMYDPESLNHTWQTTISDINGNYGLKSPILDKIYVKLHHAGRIWENTIIKGNILPTSCLLPLTKAIKTTLDRLQDTSMKTRLIPLTIAILTSAYAMIISPNYYFLIYLYLSLHLTFTEYIFPKISK